MPTKDRFVDAYEGEPPPWEIGRAQEDLVAAFDELALSGSALDLGCGTGENALELARRGLDVWGIDAAPTAIAAAEKKREGRGLQTTFIVGDALDLRALGRTFDTVLDCGLFHVLTDEERRAYAEQLTRVLRVGGRFLMFGFAAHDRGHGPRGYAPDELRAYFGARWREGFIRPASFKASFAPEGLPAWVSLFVREGSEQ